MAPEPAVIADEACTVAPRQSLLNHGMAALNHREGRALVNFRPHIRLLDREFGQRSMVIELGKTGACRSKRGLLGENALGEFREDVKLECERAVGGGG